jgi:hypothetical protein
MKHERELDTSYFHNPHSLGVNYSLFIMLLKQMVSMESKGQLGAALAASPLLSSQSSDQFHVFCVSPSPPQNPPRGPLYSQFRSRRVRGVQDCIKTTHEGEIGHTTRSSSGPVRPLLFPSLLRFPLTSSSHGLLFPKKMAWKNVWVRLTSRW